MQGRQMCGPLVGTGGPTREHNSDGKFPLKGILKMSGKQPQSFTNRRKFPRLAITPGCPQSEMAGSRSDAQVLLDEEILCCGAADETPGRLILLLRAGADFGQSLDVDETARDVVTMAVPALAELIILVQPGGIDNEWSILQAAHLGDAVAVDSFTGNNRLPAGLSDAIDKALAHGTNEYLPTESLFSIQGDPETIVIPLLGRGRVFGALAFSHALSGREFTSADERAAKEYAARAATAIDNARHCRELEDADRRKTEALSVLAHELGNQLASLRYALAAFRQGGSDETVNDSARNVLDRQVLQMAQLVDDLSDASRATNGKVRLKLEPLDLVTVVRDTAETSRLWIDDRGHRLTLRLPPEPLTVNGDRLRLSQVLTNLLHNAAKYTPPGGSLGLSLERETDEAVLRVSDNGIGIPAETLSRVFDMFMQIDRSLDFCQGGLGIGLTLVRRFVEMHGGSVQATSGGPNRGSEFVIRLPLH